MREIAALGHEIGYHYEDLALSNGIPENAIQTFDQIWIISELSIR